MTFDDDDDNCNKLHGRFVIPLFWFWPIFILLADSILRNHTKKITVLEHLILTAFKLYVID